MAPPWMLLRLAIETSTHHQAADDDRLSLLDVKTRSEYRSFLVSIFGFESAVEEAILRVKDLEPDVMRGRLRAELLKKDLFTLGLTPEVLAWMPRVPTVPIRTTPQALGWMFVLERSSLVSGLLRRHVQRTLGDSLHGADQYLAAYDVKPGARFRAFGECLGQYGRRYTPGLIVTAANDAFRAQRQWYASFGRASARGTDGGQTSVLRLDVPAVARQADRVGVEQPVERPTEPAAPRVGQPFPIAPSR